MKWYAPYELIKQPKIKRQYAKKIYSTKIYSALDWMKSYFINSNFNESFKHKSSEKFNLFSLVSSTNKKILSLW